jgi:HEAT repeat protein
MSRFLLKFLWQFSLRSPIIGRPPAGSRSDYMNNRLLWRTRALVTIAMLTGLAIPRYAHAQAATGHQGLGRGWDALEAGRYAEAASVAETALKRFPGDHGALVLKIEALSRSGQIAAAFDAYHAWSATHSRADVSLPGIVAVAVLRALGAGAPEMAVRIAALRTLAEAGDAPSREALAGLVGRAGVEGNEAMAALGDPAAASRLVSSIESSQGSRKIEAMAAAARAQAPGAAEAITPMTKNPDPAIRAGAARALSQLKDAGAADSLIGLLKDPMPAVRGSAAIALARMGRNEGDEVLAGMLDSGVPDIVLMAAEGLPDQPTRWQSVVEPLLQTESPIDRLRAARLLKDVNSAAANEVVSAALADPNPAVREEAARSISSRAAIDGAMDWPRLLSDPSPTVRLGAARALLKEMSR